MRTLLREIIERMWAIQTVELGRKVNTRLRFRGGGQAGVGRWIVWRLKIGFNYARRWVEKTSDGRAEMACAGHLIRSLCLRITARI